MNKNSVITMIVGVLVLVVIVVALAKNQSSNEQDTSTTTQSTISNQEEAMSQELGIEEVEVGEGEEAVAGNDVTVHYTGTFTDGTKFDSSVDRGEPFTFNLGAGEVIQGWDQGVAGMKVGGKRKLTVPPELGYGPNDYGSIPGGSTLLFDVELLEVN